MMNSWFSLEGTSCVVAGSEGLLGKACVKALKDCGAEVLGIDLHNVDLTSEKAVKRFFSELKPNDAEWPHPVGRKADSYVHDTKNTLSSNKPPSSAAWAFINCSYPRTANWPQLGFENLTLEDWNKNFELHLGSAFIFTQNAVEFLKKTGGGSIVNFGSIYGLAGPDLRLYEGTAMNNPAPYAAIKSGIIGLTRYVATAFGKDNIRANVVCPGGIENGQPSRFVDAYTQKTPLGRMGKPQDIAGAVAFLVGPSGRYITGQTLVIDGGFTAW